LRISHAFRCMLIQSLIYCNRRRAAVHCCSG
jgi:hypothetical protein